ncbi:MAG: alternative ribosome rescue aminoacyl-tRNA hydrolase ArfB [Desulfovibrionaceae bacterium]|nr:alternative ribosome rescue aminoacyl-tRNA hydrolase ArfB [Desulfovibrionaceae bacterium]
MALVDIPGGLSIPEEELVFTAARASGPGGQHVNKTSSAVTLVFDVAGSPSLSPGQRGMLMAALGPRLTISGLLRLTSRGRRSQFANKREVLARFVGLVAAALRPKRPRRPTRPTKASGQRRLASKARRAALKRVRKPPGPEE